MPDPIVASLMRTDFPVLRPHDMIPLVARLIADSGLPGLPVVDEEGQIVGIVTDSDIITREAAVDIPEPVSFLDAIFSLDVGRDFDEDLRKVAAVTAEELMTHPVYNILDSATLGQVATLMVERHVNPIPVVDDNHNLVGIVARADLVRVIARLENEPDTAKTSEAPVVAEE